MLYIFQHTKKINNGTRRIDKKKQKKCVCAVLLLAEVLLLQTSGSLSFWNKIKKLLHLWQNILVSCLFLVPSNKREYIISISPMTTKSYLCYQSEIGMFADERRDEGQKHLFFSFSMQQNILNFLLFSSYKSMEMLLY